MTIILRVNGSRLLTNEQSWAEKKEESLKVSDTVDTAWSCQVT